MPFRFAILCLVARLCAGVGAGGRGLHELAATNIDEGDRYRYELKAEERNSNGNGKGKKGGGNDDEITFAAPLLPRWLSFDGKDELSGRPQAADVGTHSVRVTASVGGQTAVQNFQILVKVDGTSTAGAGPNADSRPARSAADQRRSRRRNRGHAQSHDNRCERRLDIQRREPVG